MPPSDGQLVESCLAGSHQAWNELIDRYARLVFSIPRRYGMAEADAEDVFQSVWSIAFQKLHSLRQQDRLSSWLITTTHRECWRVGKQRDSVADIDSVMADVASPNDDQLELWERQHQVRHALRELGGKCEELLHALFYEPAEGSYESLAARLNMRVGSIGPTRARCFEKLAKILRNIGFEPGFESEGGKIE